MIEGSDVAPTFPHRRKTRCETPAHVIRSGGGPVPHPVLLKASQDHTKQSPLQAYKHHRYHYAIKMQGL